jgi:alpha-ketoglutarate-dependent taurine dioxygenase
MTTQGKFKISRRQGISIADTDLTIEQLPDSGKAMPFIIRPAMSGVDLLEHARINRESINEKLLRHGGILFRGFDVATAAQLEQFIRNLSGDLLQYSERSSPRTQVAGNIYTSTDYPADQEIFFHNENSYQQAWPLKIAFLCLTPALEGGETPIADTRKVYQRISADVRERFERKGVQYVRNFSRELGLPWQTVFQTDDPAVVERYCALGGIQCEWKGDHRLTTRVVRKAIASHPVSHELTWFNHAVFLHISTLPPDTRNALTGMFKDEDLPNNTYYGDGAPIEAEVLDHLREAYREEAVMFPWQTGDVLMLENMLVAHSRSPFTGPRKVLVGMSELFQSPQ